MKVAVSFALVAALAGCGGPARMGGFAEHEALADPPAIPVEPCDVRNGRFVLEIESAVVRDYPHHGTGREHGKQQPLVALWIEPPAADAPAQAEMVALTAPPVYLPGDPIYVFEGRRLLDRPARALRGRQLTLRLAENDRTTPPAWATYATEVSSAAGAASLAGVPSPPQSLLATAVDELRRIDRDDLIIIWRVPFDRLLRDLAPEPRRQVMRYRLQTPRRVATGPGTGLAAAEMVLLAYVEPEPGCPAPPPPPPPPPTFPPTSPVTPILPPAPTPAR